VIYLVDDLLASAKRSEFFPVSQTTLDDDDLMAFADEETATIIVPHISSVKQNYFLARKLTSIYANLDHYEVPERAQGESLKDVFYVPDTTNLANKWPISQLQVHDQSASSGGGGNTFAGFFPMGTEIALVPVPTVTQGALMYYFYKRHNRFIATTSCAKITGVSSVGGTTTLTVDTDLTASLVVASIVDIAKGRSPSRLLAEDVAITAITATTIDIATADVSDEISNVLPRVGDYVCPAQYTNVMTLPYEYGPVLGELIAARACRATGAIPNFERAMDSVKTKLEGVRKLISVRVEGEPEVILDRSGLMSSVRTAGPQGMLR
jgi:hypothetical protein